MEAGDFTFRGLSKMNFDISREIPAPRSFPGLGEFLIFLENQVRGLTPQFLLPLSRLGGRAFYKPIAPGIFPITVTLQSRERQVLLLAWGFGGCAPEASVGMGRDAEKTRIFRNRRREALAPAPSAEKSPPYDSKRSTQAPRPGNHRLFTTN